MKQIYCAWRDEEVVKLFNFIEKGKSQNKNLSALFAEYAKSTNRKANSVRNYYYAELKNLEQDKSKCLKLNIDLSKHEKCLQKSFDENETKEIICNLLKLIDKGYSVRKACFTIANGDISKMVRYQNKYRILLQNNPEYIETCKQELSEQGYSCGGCKIIKMKTKTTRLQDSEINSLFLGLVKLVKKQAQEQVGEELKNQTEYANNALRKTLVELSNKETEIKELRKSFKLLQMKNMQLNQKITNLRAINAENLLNNVKKLKKMQDFKSFAQNLVDKKDIKKLKI